MQSQLSRCQGCCNEVVVMEHNYQKWPFRCPHPHALPWQRGSNRVLETLPVRCKTLHSFGLCSAGGFVLSRNRSAKLLWNCLLIRRPPAGWTGVAAVRVSCGDRVRGSFCLSRGVSRWAVLGPKPSRTSAVSQWNATFWVTSGIAPCSLSALRMRTQPWTPPSFLTCVHHTPLAQPCWKQLKP